MIKPPPPPLPPSLHCLTALEHHISSFSGSGAYLTVSKEKGV